MMGHEGLVLYLLTVYLAIIRGFSLLFIDHKEYARFFPTMPDKHL